MCAFSPGGISASEDVRLMISVARGDAAAFAELHARFSLPLLNLARSIVRSLPAAEDVRQEVFQELWNRAGEYRASLGTPFSWIMTIARHKAIDRLRAEVRQVRQRADYDAAIGPLVTREEWGADFRVMAAEAGSAVHEALAQLSALERAAVELAFFEGLSSAEISRRLAIPVATIKGRLRRALRHLERPLAAFRHAGGAASRDFPRG